MSVIKIKKCPCCDGEAYYISYDRVRFRVRCVECGLETKLYIGEEKAIEAWNKRTKE